MMRPIAHPSGKETWYINNTNVEGHDHNNCNGNCPIHFLLTDEIMFLYQGMSWGNFVYYEEMKKEAQETLEERLARINKENARQALKELEISSYEMNIYAEKVKIRTHIGIKKGQGIKKRAQPCKWVCGEHKGEDCWAHIRTDPMTGEKMSPLTCDRLHPGEEGWLDIWFDQPNYNPSASATQNRFSALKGRVNK
jgi:hypothetical protein